MPIFERICLQPNVVETYLVSCQNKGDDMDAMPICLTCLFTIKAFSHVVQHHVYLVGENVGCDVHGQRICLSYNQRTKKKKVVFLRLVSCFISVIWIHCRSSNTFVWRQTFTRYTLSPGVVLYTGGMDAVPAVEHLCGGEERQRREDGACRAHARRQAR